VNKPAVILFLRPDQETAIYNQNQI